jgi:hypothetical protein
MHEHPLTGLTAFGIVVLLLGGLLLSPTPAFSVSTLEPTRITLATPEPPKQIEPAQPPTDDVAPPVTGTREPPKPTEQHPTRPPEPDNLTRRVAEALGLKPETLTLVTVFQVTWSNSCLGCQQPGTQCLQVLTPGAQRLYRDADGREYDVRVGRNEQFLICAAPQQLTDSKSASPARPGAAELTSAETETAAPVGAASVAGTPLVAEATRAVAAPNASAPAAPTQAEQQLAAALTAPATADAAALADAAASADAAPVAVAAPVEAGVPVAEVTDIAAPSREIVAVVGGLWLLLLAAVCANVWYRRQRSRG